MNIIYLIIDSLSYERLESLKDNFGYGSFINDLAENGISFEKMYSQAPYTEAAAQAMYCGQKTLDKGGHLFRFKNAQWTIFEKAKQKNLSTFYSNVLLQLFTSSTKRGVDFYHYNNGFELDGLWNYRLSYYKNLYDSNAINDADYSVLKIILDENFAEWKMFFENISKKEKETRLLLSDFYNYDIGANYSLLVSEYEKYKVNKQKYIESILELGKKHALFKIQAYTQSNKVPQGLKIDVWNANKKTINKIRHIQFRNNLSYFLFNKYSRSETKKVLKSKSLRALKTYLGNEYLFLKPTLLRKKTFLDYDSYKIAPSLSSFIASFIDWRKANPKKDYFACLHVDDIHHTEIFFDYDSQNIDSVNYDFDEAKKLLKAMKKNYKGPLLYDLGIYYVGRRIKKLYSFIDRCGELENTLFVITSDHGFSYQGLPTREKNISTFYKENYHIPAIFYKKGITPKKISDFYNSYEIPDIIFNIMEDSELPQSKGYSTIEFLGSGCPDISRKPIKIACHNELVMVCGDYSINDVASLSNCIIYNLALDPLQCKALSYNSIQNNSFLCSVVESFISLINKRLLEIKKENTDE